MGKTQWGVEGYQGLEGDENTGARLAVFWRNASMGAFW